MAKTTGRWREDIIDTGRGFVSAWAGPKKGDFTVEITQMGISTFLLELVLHRGGKNNYRVLTRENYDTLSAAKKEGMALLAMLP